MERVHVCAGFSQSDLGEACLQAADVLVAPGQQNADLEQCCMKARRIVKLFCLVWKGSSAFELTALHAGSQCF